MLTVLQNKKIYIYLYKFLLPIVNIPALTTYNAYNTDVKCLIVIKHGEFSNRLCNRFLNGYATLYIPTLFKTNKL